MRHHVLAPRPGGGASGIVGGGGTAGGGGAAGGSLPVWLSSVRNGCNLVGMNMDLSWNRTTGPTRNTSYPQFTNTLLDWLQTKGIDCVRLMFTWEAVQSSLGGSVPPSSGTGYANYWSDFTSTITRCLSRGIAVMIAPWQYNPAIGDTDVTYNGAAFTSANFADFWGKLATAVNSLTSSDQRVAFDLINEPHVSSGGSMVGVTLTNWYDDAQAAIDAIRATGASNTIFVPGMNYTAAAYFTTNGSAAQHLALTDSASNLAVTVHSYSQFSAHSTSSTAQRDACTALVTWARTNGVKVHVSEIAQDVNANGVTTLQAQTTWADWASFVAANTDVLVGWAWWGQGASGWWDAADYHWGLTLNDGSSQTKFMDLIESSL